MIKLSDPFIDALEAYYRSCSKNTDEFVWLFSEEDLQKAKEFDMNTPVLIRGEVYKSCVLVNSWYRWYCKVSGFENIKEPYHYLWNPDGLTVKDFIDALDNVMIERDHVYFEGFTSSENYRDQILVEVQFGS